MSMKLITLTNLSTFANEIKNKYATVSALTALQNKVTALEDVGAEANVLEGVKINGTALTIASKMVDILVATGTDNGTIKVNGADVAVKGLQDLAFKANISESDLDTALAAVIAAKASGEDLTALAARVTTAEGALTTLNGTGAGSVDKKVADAVAAIVADAPQAYDTLKEISDWISSHGSDAATMQSNILTNANGISALEALVGELPEDAVSDNIVDYIAELIADIGIGDYATVAELTSGLAGKADKVTGATAGNFAGLDANGNLTDSGKKAADFVAAESGKRLMTDAEGTKLSGISTGANKVEASTNNGKIKIDGTEVTVYTEPSDVVHEADISDVVRDADITDVVRTGDIVAVTSAEITALLAD